MGVLVGRLAPPAQVWFLTVSSAAAIVAAAAVVASIWTSGTRWGYVLVFSTAISIVRASPLVVDHRPDGEVIAPEELVLLPALMMLGPVEFLAAATLSAPLGELAVRFAAPVTRMRSRTPEKHVFNAAVGLAAATTGLVAQWSLTEIGTPALVALPLSGLLMWWASHALVARMVGLTATDPVIHPRQTQIAVGLPTLVLGFLTAAALDVAVEGLGWRALWLVPAVAIGIAVGSRFQAREVLRRGHLSALLEATQPITGTVDPSEVEARLLQRARTALTARRSRLETDVRRVHPSEAAAALAPDGPWLVVSDRAAYYRRFDASDVELLEGLAAIGAAAMERARAVAALREREEFRALTLAALSHDLRAPLGKAALAAGMLLDADLDPSTREEIAAAHERSLRRMRNIIDDLVDLGRMEHGQRPAGRADVLEVVHEVVEQLDPARGCRIETVGTSARAVVDARILGRILDNLLENAVSHGPAESTVTVAVTPRAATVELSVCDQGQGVPENVRDHVFDPYRSGPGSVGIGLGLYIARRFAQHAGGTLDLGPQQDVGTCFVLELPRESDGRDPVREEPRPDIA